MSIPELVTFSFKYLSSHKRMLQKTKNNCMTNELVTFIANLALSLSFIVALIFGIAEVRVASRDRRERLTLELCATFKHANLRNSYILLSRMICHLIVKNSRRVLPTSKLFLFNSDRKWESLGILVAERLINIDLVDKTLGSFVTTSWEKYKRMYLTYVKGSRILILENTFNGLLSGSMSEWKKNPREPFYKTNTFEKSGKLTQKKQRLNDIAQISFFYLHHRSVFKIVENIESSYMTPNEKNIFAYLYIGGIKWTFKSN